jgi:hypothetical protein
MTRQNRHGRRVEVCARTEIERGHCRFGRYAGKAQSAASFSRLHAAPTRAAMDNADKLFKCDSWACFST